VKKILVIDDEVEFRTTLQDVLESRGYEVEGTSYLASSVGWGLTGGFDLITLDLRMPEVDGLEVARLYSKLVPDTRLLVISGYLDKATIKELGSLGVTHTVTKPAGISDLLEAVNSALTPVNGNGTTKRKQDTNVPAHTSAN
jgi:CheY-like chemotaxis protein